MILNDDPSNNLPIALKIIAIVFVSAHRHRRDRLQLREPGTAVLDLPCDVTEKGSF